MLFKEVICSHLTGIYFTVAVCNVSGTIPLLGRQTTNSKTTNEISYIYAIYTYVCMYIYHIWAPWWLSGTESAAMQETQVQSLGQKDQGNGNLLQYSCLEIPWTEEPGGLSICGTAQESGVTEHAGTCVI